MQLSNIPNFAIFIFNIWRALGAFQAPATLPNKSPATTNIPDRPQFVYLTLWTATGGPTKETGPPYTLLYNLITQYHSSHWVRSPVFMLVGDRVRSSVRQLWRFCVRLVAGWCMVWRYFFLCVSEVFCLLEINCRRLPCMGCFFRCLHPLAVFWVVGVGCVWYWSGL